MTVGKQKQLQDGMSLGRKVGLFIDYLKRGGELEIDGRTWVWLDNHITRTEVDGNGEEQYFGINGLAIKCEKISRGVTSDHYIGQSDISLQYLLYLIDHIKEIDWFGMTAGAALQSLTKQRP